MNKLELDIDLDTQRNNLEREWRLMYEDSIVARAEYQSLAAGRQAGIESLDMARERLDHAEAQKSRIMAKIERLESRMLGSD